MIEIAIKLLATALIAWNLRSIYRAWRRGKFDMDYLWMLGLIVFSVVAQWVSGLALIFAWTSMLICFVALMVAVLRMRREAKQLRAEMAELTEWRMINLRILEEIVATQATIIEASPVKEEHTDDQCI